MKRRLSRQQLLRSESTLTRFIEAEIDAALKAADAGVIRDPQKAAEASALIAEITKPTRRKK